LGIRRRTAEGSAEIVLPVHGDRHREEPAGIEGIIADEVEGSAVDTWLVPDLETKDTTPPPARPYSALKPLVSTRNWLMASSEGAFTAAQVVELARLVPPRLRPIARPSRWPDRLRS